MVGHAHCVGADRCGGWAIHRAGEHKHIAFGAHHVFARVLFDARPRAAVVFGQLRHHVGQRKTLRHALDRAHVARRRHVPARIAGVFVVVERGALAFGQTCIRKKSAAARHAALRQGAGVQALHHKHGRARLAVVQHGEVVVTEFAPLGFGRDARRLSAGEERGTGSKTDRGRHMQHRLCKTRGNDAQSQRKRKHTRFESQVTNKQDKHSTHKWLLCIGITCFITMVPPE